jgi:DNA-binding MarR family transcriptional regulator
MAPSSDLRTDRLAIGQLLGRLLAQFRHELFAVAGDRGYADIREAHLQVFGNVGTEGIRLTELAAQSLLSLAATSELVNDLQSLGYLERRPDPSDGRAKLIHPTPKGIRALDHAGDRVAEIEQHWSELVGAAKFERACRILQDLLDANTRD